MTKKTSFNNLSLQRQTYIRQQKHYHAIITFVRLFILAGFIALWEISAATGVINPFIFSSPSRILNTFIYMAKDGSIFMHIFVTLF